MCAADSFYFCFYHAEGDIGVAQRGACEWNTEDRKAKAAICWEQTGNSLLMPSSTYRLLNWIWTEASNNRPWLGEWRYTLGFNCNVKCTAISRKKEARRRGQWLYLATTPVIIGKLLWHLAVICFVMTENSWGWVLPDCYAIKNCACGNRHVRVCRQQGEPLHHHPPNPVSISAVASIFAVPFSPFLYHFFFRLNSSMFTLTMFNVFSRVYQ